MRRLTRSLAGPIALALGAACGDHPLAPLPATLVTDAGHYFAMPDGKVNYGFTLIATFTNTGRYAVHLSRCFHDTPFPIHGIDTARQDTAAAYNPGWACVGGNEFRVPPGEMRVDTIPVTAPWSIDGRTGEVIGVFEGEFVLSYEMYGCVDETPACTTPVHGIARSAPFTVTRAK